MHSQLCAGLPQLLIGNELRHLSVAVSTGQATLLWRSSLLTMTSTSSGKCYTTNISTETTTSWRDNWSAHVRQRRHNPCLTVKTADRNFVIRQLFKDLYWRPSLSIGLTVFCFYSKTGFWPSYCQISTDLDNILYTSIVVRNTLVGRLRQRSDQNKTTMFFCITCNAP